MVLSAPRQSLEEQEWACPRPKQRQVLVRVLACGVCRTDLHLVDGELPNPKLPVVPGHEIIGEVAAVGEEVGGVVVGERVGVPWLGSSCGACGYCRSGRENLCGDARFHGYTLDGGFAEYALVDERYCLSVPEIYSAVAAAPLMCAGLIGYRCLRRAGAGRRLGLYGFGAAAHILAQVAVHQGREIYAFTRPGDESGQTFARRLGAVWAGGSDEAPPQPLDAAILFAPAGELVPRALQTVARGGTVVCGGIHMSEIPAFPYEILWGERTVCSVANLTRRDGEEFLELAGEVHLRTEVKVYPLSSANEALEALRRGLVQGAAVLEV